MKNAAVPSDDVDLGWDDAAPSQKVSEIRDLSPQRSFVEVQHEALPLQSELPSTRELENPDFRRGEIGPAVIVSAMAAVIALIAGSVGSAQFPTVAAPSPESVVTRLLKEPLAQPLPEPQSPEPAPSGSVSTSAGPSAPPRETSAEKARANAVTVTVSVIPENSVIFRAGQKLGSGAIELSVERDAKEHLIAFHDGYIPAHFTLDGSRNTVTVRLQRVPSPQASARYVSDSPF